MRWEALFADLEAGAQADAEAERRSEVADRTRAEFGRVRLIDRLQPLLAQPQERVRMGLAAGDPVSGRVAAIGADWVLLAEPTAGREWLIPLSAVQWVDGLGPESAEPGWEGLVGARYGLRIILRRIVRDRATVVVTLLSGDIRRGRLERVHADHVVLRADAAAGEAFASVTLPLAAIACLRPV